MVSEQRRKRGPGVYTDSEDLIWEMLDSDFSPAECQLQSKEPPPLLKLYSVLFAAIKNQCQLTFEYLSNLSNVYDLIAEYAIRVKKNIEKPLVISLSSSSGTLMSQQCYSLRKISK